VGAYLHSLSDLNTTNHTFTADFWLWFVHPRTVDLKPLKTVEPDNARDYRPSLETTEDFGAERYHAAKVRGVFNYALGRAQFPFRSPPAQRDVERSAVRGGPGPGMWQTPRNTAVECGALGRRLADRKG